MNPLKRIENMAEYGFADLQLEESANMHSDAIELMKEIKQLQSKLEALEAENKQLKGEEPISYAWWEECPKLAQRTMERIIDENKELLLEIVALKAEIDEYSAENKELKRPLESAGYKTDGMMAVGQELIQRDLQIKALTAELEKAKEPCEWIYDENGECWIASCGELFTFDKGTPKDNNMKFCCSCGKPIILPKQALKGGK